MYNVILLSWLYDYYAGNMQDDPGVCELFFITYWDIFRVIYIWVLCRCNSLYVDLIGTRLSLDVIKRRLQGNRYVIGEESREGPKPPPLFSTNVILEIPNVVARPNLDDLQHTLSKGIQIILKASQNMKPWEHQVMYQRQLQKVR